MSLITIKTFDSSMEAHLIKSKLESEGIICFLFDENVISMNPLSSNALGGIKLKVNGHDIDKTIEIITTLENTKATNENNEIICCPKCNSEELYFGFRSFKSVKGILSATLSFMLGVFPIYQKTVYRCKSCSHEFKA